MQRNPSFDATLAALAFAGLQVATVQPAQAQSFSGLLQQHSAHVSWSHSTAWGVFQNYSKGAAVGVEQQSFLSVSADLPEGNLATVSAGASGDKVSVSSVFEAISPIQVFDYRYASSEARSNVSYSLTFAVLKSQSYRFSLDIELDPSFSHVDFGFSQHADLSSSFRLSQTGGLPDDNVIIDHTTKDDFTTSFTQFLEAGEYELVGQGYVDLDNLVGPFGGSHRFSLVPIPEPSTYALMLVGLGAVGAIARRRPSS